jgi:DNA-binding NtrC family response regulator
VRASKRLPKAEEVVTVLLASPHKEDHASLRGVLHHSNWRLLGAFDVRGVLRLLHKQVVPVLICDCDLPDGGWKTLLEEFPKLPCAPRLIVSSRLADSRLWAEALNFGCYDVFPTPYRAEEVFRVVCLAWHSWKHEFEQGGALLRLPESAPGLRSLRRRSRAAGGAT